MKGKSIISYWHIIEKKIGVPKNEVYGINECPEGKIGNKFLFKVMSYERYKYICARVIRSKCEIEKGNLDKELFDAAFEFADLNEDEQVTLGEIIHKSDPGNSILKFASFQYLVGNVKD